MTLGETIQYYRKRSGLSQEALAELVGVSRQAVSKWELDEASPEVNNLKTLAGAFGITIDQLLSGEIPPASDRKEPDPQPQTPPPPRKELPGLWGIAAQRLGALLGIRIAVSGGVLSLFGIALRFLHTNTLHTLTEAGYSSGTSFIQAEHLLSGLSIVVLILGVVMILASIIMAVFLRKNDPNK